MGCLMCYGSKIGWYHRVFLPVIVLELSGGGGSIWGAIDLCALCMVAAGTYVVSVCVCLCVYICVLGVFYVCVHVFVGCVL